MKIAPIPKNEQERLVSLHNLGQLDTQPEERFDLITRTALTIFHVPISTLTLVDAKREWFKSCQGLSVHEGDRAISFCGHALLSDNVLVIPDTKKDVRFADNPMVKGAPYLRFYAGVPVLSADGQRVGVLCIKDTKPREFSRSDEEVLKRLASWAEVELNRRNLSMAYSEQALIQKKQNDENLEFVQSEKLQADLRKAILNVMEDLEQSKAEIEVERAKGEAMLASIGDGMVAVDQNARVIFMNAALEKLIGWKTEEIIGKSWFEIVSMEDDKGNAIPNDQRPIRQSITSKKSTTTTTTTTTSIYYFVRKDKTKFPVAVTTTPIILNGKVIGAIGLYRDITREKEVDKAKSEFVSLASHQLRTPLGITKWYLEVLQKDKYFAKAPKTLRDYFEVLSKNNERVLSLVRELLSVSRIEQGQVKNTPKLIASVKIIKTIVDEMQLLASKKHIQLSFEMQALEVPNLYIDPSLFHESVENLVVNAIEYTPANGSVVVSIDRNDQSIQISVEDSGIGISRDDQGNIFNKFFRLPKAIAMNPEGSGLGLYVVKSYIEGWGGKISVESEEGKGSTFCVSLPLIKKDRKVVS